MFEEYQKVISVAMKKACFSDCADNMIGSWFWMYPLVDTTSLFFFNRLEKSHQDRLNRQPYSQQISRFISWKFGGWFFILFWWVCVCMFGNFCGECMKVEEESNVNLCLFFLFFPTRPNQHLGDYYGRANFLCNVVRYI